MRLKNARDEAFAQLVAIGSTETADYIEAGFSTNSAGQGAERLTRNPVVARVCAMTSPVCCVLDCYIN